jgi:ubiquinone/menaquinone biosynthesis C-methylase UbiE
MQVEHQHHPPKSATEYAHVLKDPTRDQWQKPHEVITALALKPEEAIADIGAGNGYFSERFARHVAKVYAVDIEPKLLEMIQGDKIERITALPNDPKLPAASVDTVFLCNVTHHIENRGPYWEKVAAALKPGGRIVILEFHKKPLPVGPGPGMKIAQGELVKELAAAGFKVAREHKFLPYQYFLEFKRR